MQFTVPKFLEREALIAFGLTFKRLAVAGGLGFLIFILKYLIPKFLWVLAIIFIAGGFVALNFIKIGGHRLYELLVNSFQFFSSARIYVWKQKQGVSPMKLVRKEVEEKKEEQVPLKIAPRSRLGGLRSKIDISAPGGNETT